MKIKYELVRSILIKPLNVSKSPPKVGEIFLLTVNLAKIFCELGQGRDFLTIVGRLIPNRLPIVVIVKLEAYHGR